MKKIHSCFLTFIIVINTYAQQIETITFQASDIVLSKTTANQTIFDVISLANASPDFSKPGAPQLPVKYVKFIVPANKAVVSVSIISSQKQIIGSSFNIYPQQYPQIADENPAGFVTPDPAIYGSSLPWPASIVQYEYRDYCMGQNIVTLKIILPDSMGFAGPQSAKILLTKKNKFLQDFFYTFGFLHLSQIKN